MDVTAIENTAQQNKTGYLNIPKALSSDSNEAAIEQALINSLVQSSVKLQRLSPQYSPSNPEQGIIGVRAEPGVAEKILQIQTTANALVASGEVSRYFEYSQAGRAEFLSLAKENPANALEVMEAVRYVEQTNSLKKFLPDEQKLQIESGQFVGRTMTGEFTAEEKQLASLASSAMEFLGSKHYSNHNNFDNATAEKVKELGEASMGPSWIVVSVRELGSIQKELENRTGGLPLNQSQVSDLITWANDSMLKVAQAYPSQMDLIENYFQKAQALEDSCEKTGYMGYSAYKDFSKAIEETQTQFTNFYTQATAEALTKVSPLVQDLADQSRAAIEKLSDITERHLSEGPAQGVTGFTKDAHKMGFIAASVEASAVFDEMKKVSPALDNSEKTAMLPDLGRILETNRVQEATPILVAQVSKQTEKSAELER